MAANSIARDHISERTARAHVSNILAKLGLSSRTQAALWAVREGMVDLDGGPGARGRSRHGGKEAHTTTTRMPAPLLRAPSDATLGGRRAPVARWFERRVLRPSRKGASPWR